MTAIKNIVVIVFMLLSVIAVSADEVNPKESLDQLKEKVSKLELFTVCGAVTASVGVVVACVEFSLPNDTGVNSNFPLSDHAGGQIAGLLIGVCGASMLGIGIPCVIHNKRKLRDIEIKPQISSNRVGLKLTACF